MPMHSVKSGENVEKGEPTPVHCWWEYKFVKSLWKTVWRFLKNFLKTTRRSNTSTSGNSSEENKNIDLRRYMFIAALFTTAKVWNNLSVHQCCCCSVAKSCLTLCDPMDYSTPGSPVRHYLPEFAQIHVHQVGGAIQPSHPLSSPSSPAFNLSQPQGLFQWVRLFTLGGQSTGASASASVLPMNIHGGFPLGLTG